MKEWYCLFKGKKEGPYSLMELRRHPRFTPDTFVWRKGFSKWVKASTVREIAKIFREEEKRSENQKKGPEKRTSRGDDILAAIQTPPPYFWLFAFIMIIIFLLFYSYYL